MTGGERRIALVPSSYHPHVGGVEEHTRNLARELTTAGHGVQIWTVRRDGLPARDCVDGVTVRRLEAPVPSIRPRTLGRFAAVAPRAIAEWRTVLQEWDPQLIHVHCFGPNGVYASALGRHAGVPLVLSLHGETFMDDERVFNRSATLRRALRCALRNSAAVTGCSQITLEDAITRFGLSRGRGQVVPNGIDEFEASTAERPWARPAGRYVLALGRQVPNKGFDLLLDAFAVTARRELDVDLVLGGTGSQHGLLRHQAARLGISDRVHFPGQLDRAAVYEAMAGADVFVMPSRIEAFGIVILEAWRAGTAVIASNRGGAPEFVCDGEDGLLVDPNATHRLADMLTNVLTSPQRRNRLAVAGHRRVAEFAWDRIAQQYEAIYKRLGSAC